MSAESQPATAPANTPTPMRGVPASDHSERLHAPKKSAGSIGLMLTALGVVFGDIGTSPLYTLRECIKFLGPQTPEQVRGDVLDLLSLIFWSLTVVVTVKYLIFIMHADNKGEGGIMALLALVPESLRAGPLKPLSAVAVLVVVGASFLYGDGAITPAISVLSAVEGITVAREGLEGWVLPIT